MRTNRRTAIIAALAVVMIGATAHAEPKQSRFRSKPAATRKSAPVPRASDKDHTLIREDGKLTLYKKKNIVDFDDSLIEGEVRNPSEFYFVHRPEEKFNSLVQRRKNFQKEMLRDTVMIR